MSSYIAPHVEMRAWDAVKARETMTTKQLRLAYPMTVRESEEIVRRWVKEGRITFVERSETGWRYYAIRADFAPPVEDRGRSPEDNMWLSMRKLRSYSVADIVFQANSADAPVTEAMARDYIRALLAAKFIRVLRKASDNLPALYVTSKKKSVRAPILRRVRVIEDPNTGAIFLLTGREL